MEENETMEQEEMIEEQAIKEPKPKKKAIQSDPFGEADFLKKVGL